MILLLAAVLGIAGGVIWKTQLLAVVDIVPSPDGRQAMAVLEVELNSISSGEKIPAVSIRSGWPLNPNDTSYLYTSYEGLYWSPDSEKYLLEMIPMKDGYAELSLVDKGGSAAIKPVLLDAMEQSGLLEYGFRTDDGDYPIVTLSFSQWNEESTAIRFRYEFTDCFGSEHSGTFWYRINWVTSDSIFGIEEDT